MFSDTSEGGLTMLKNMYFWLATIRSCHKENAEIGASELARNVKVWKNGIEQSCWDKASSSEEMSSLGILPMVFFLLADSHLGLRTSANADEH